MRNAPLLLALLLTACASEVPVEVLDAPPDGWTEVAADLPGFSEHRGYLQYGEGLAGNTRETHFFLDSADGEETVREVHVTLFGEPSLIQRAWRWTADEPLSLNRTPDTSVEPVAPESLGLSPDLARKVEAAFTFRDTYRNGRGTVVRVCEAGRCYEVIGGGPDDGSPEAEASYANLIDAVRVGA